MCNQFNGNQHQAGQGACSCPGGRLSRFIQPCLLLLLLDKPSYGYELIEGVSEFGFLDGPPDPGAVYRNLRRMERDGLVTSKWKTAGSGPAKRYYELTSDGEELLHAWASRVSKRKAAFEKFLKRYKRHFKKGGSKNV